MTWVAGADGCKGGWFVVLQNVETGQVWQRRMAAFEAILRQPEAPAVIGVDMVIGLPEQAERGGRECDRAARKLLGWPRASSVFSPPARAALAAATYAEALALNRAHSADGLGIAKQAFHLFPKLRAVDAVLTPVLQEQVVEVHPELSFYAMNGDAAVAPSKRTEAGRHRRLGLLEACGFAAVREAVTQHAGDGLQPDDILDAHAVCWSAGRILRGEAVRVPADPPTDARGLRMEIWR